MSILSKIFPSFQKKQLFKNTIMLYLLQFSNYFFSFITVPYQTRVLGKVVYGQIGVACAVMAYFQLLMDFGFLLSATEDISKNREDRDYINRKLTSVTLLKIFLIVLSVAVMGSMCIFVQKFAQDPKLYMIYLLAFAVNSLLPDYLYRGLEQMTAISVRTVIIKFLSTMLIFIFLKEPEDYLLVPGFLLVGNVVAVVFAYLHIFIKLKYSFTKITKKDLFSDFKRSLFFFFSRIAGTIYSTTNLVILGFVDTAGIVTGYYTCADKVVTTAKNCLSPVSDSLYPYMIKNRDFKSVKKVLCIFMPVIIVGCIVFAVFARQICSLVFGSEYADTAPILCAMLPTVVIILPSYIFGFPVLGAMGLSKYANLSILVGTGVQLAGLAVLFFTDQLTGISLAVLTSVAEFSILICRLAFVFKNRHLLNNNEVDK